MARPITQFLILITPLLVFFSAMAMTPLLVALALLALMPLSRGHLRTTLRALAADKTLLLILACLLVWPLFSALWSIAPAVSLLAWLRVTAMCCIGALAWKASVDSAPLAPRAVQWLTLTLILVCLLILLEQLPTRGVMGLVAEHTGGDINSFLRKTVNRGLCALAILIWPIFFGLERMGQRRLGVGLVVLLGIALMNMQSMSAQLGYVAGLLTLLLVRSLPRFAPLFLMMAVPVLFFAMPFLTMWLLHQPITISHLPQLRDISSGRILIWPALLEAASGHDWLGSGIKTSNLFVIPKATLDAIPLDATPLHPHHSMLQIWLELGTIGLALVTVALALLLRRLRANFAPSHPAQAAIYATVLAYLGAGFSSFSIWQNWWQAMPWILLLLWQYLLPRGLNSSVPPNK
jgi:O-antigen ligase